MSDNVTAATLLAATASITVVGTMLPPLAEVRKGNANSDFANDVRMGELAAFGTITALGVVASSLTKSPIPGIVAVVSAAALVLMYEGILQAKPKEKVEATGNGSMSV